MVCYLQHRSPCSGGKKNKKICVAGAAQRTIRMFVISKSRTAKSSSALASELQALGFPNNESTTTFASQLLDRFATKRQPSVRTLRPARQRLHDFSSFLLRRHGRISNKEPVAAVSFCLPLALPCYLWQHTAIHSDTCRYSSKVL